MISNWWSQWGLYVERGREQPLYHPTPKRGLLHLYYSSGEFVLKYWPHIHWRSNQWNLQTQGSVVKCGKVCFMSGQCLSNISGHMGRSARWGCDQEEPHHRDILSYSYTSGRGLLGAMYVHAMCGKWGRDVVFCWCGEGQWFHLHPTDIRDHLYVAPEIPPPQR